MDKNRQYKVALVLYTQGIDYDDRIRKEMLSIMKLYPNVSFKIFAVEPKNREEEGISSYGVPYRIPYLKSRDKYASASHTIAKAWDFYKTIRKDLKEFDAVWCADIETFLFVLFNCRKPLLWDLHELPGRFMHSKPMKTLFRFLEKKCDVMIHANGARRQILIEKGYVSDPEKHYVLRNYPEFNEIDSEYDELYHKFEAWLGGNQCVYLQGMVAPDRAPYESVSAVLSYPDLKAVVVGRFDNKALDQLKQEYGEELEKRVFFTGMVKQLKTPQYIRKCFMALVFYKNTELNNWYCEANRFYQNILNDNPVVVGSNPPMKELVDKYGFGIAIDSDGSNVQDIKEGIQQLISNYDTYKQNIAKHKENLLWNNQDGVIGEIVEKFIEK